METANDPQEPGDPAFDRVLGQWLGSLVMGITASFITILAVRLILLPHAGLGSDSLFLGTSLAAFSAILFLPWSRWQTAPRKLRLGIALALGIAVANKMPVAWLLGVPSLWNLPMIGTLGALLVVAFEIAPPSRRRRLLGLTATQLGLSVACLIVLLVVSLVAWFGPGGQTPEASMLLSVFGSAIAAGLAWGAGLVSLRRGAPIDQIRQQQARAIFSVPLIAIPAFALLYPWIQAHSQQSYTIEHLLGGMFMVFAMAAVLVHEPARRRLPLILVVAWLSWSLLVGRSHAPILMTYLSFSSLVFGLLLPAKRGWLATGLFAAVLASTLTAPGVELQSRLIVNYGLASSVLFCLSLWLNRRLEAFATDRAGSHATPPVAGNPVYSERTDRLSRLAGLGVMLVAMGVGCAWLYLDHRSDRVHIKEKAQIEAESIARRLAHLFANGEYLAQAMGHLPLSSLASQRVFEEQVEELRHLAGQGITLEWAPQGVVRYVHPLAGNEPAVGHDLLADPRRREDVEHIIATGEAHWSGPFPLVQGGVGVVYRMPVFHPAGVPSAPAFAGLAVSLFRFPAVLNPLLHDIGDYEFRVWIATGDQAPVQVWGAATPAPADEGSLEGFARSLVEHDPQQEHRAIVQQSSRHARQSPLKIQVAAQPLALADTNRLPGQFQILIVVAALLGWLASGLARNQLERLRVAQWTQEFTRMRNMLALSVAGIALFHRNGAIVSHNATAMKVFKATAEQLGQINLWHTPQWQRLGWTDQALATFADGVDRVIEFQGIGSLGQSLDIQLTLSRSRIGDEDYLLIQGIDLSHIHATQQALKDSEARRFELLAAHSRDILLFMRQEDGRLLEANAAAVAAYGYSREDLLGLRLHDLRAPETTAAIEQQMATAAAQGLLFESVHRRRDGSLFPVEVSSQGAVIGETHTLISIIRDISERKLAERALRASEARLRTLIDTIPDLVWLKDPDGVYLICNPRVEQLLGAQAAAIVGKTDHDIFPPDQAAFFRARDAAAVAAGGPTMNEEEVTFACDGHHELLQTIKTPVYDPQGQLMGVLGIARDMSQRKRLESDLMAAKLVAEAASVAKSTFLANMSHEIRTPMNAVLGLAYLLERQDLPEEARALAHKIHQSGHNLLGILNDILDLSKIESDKLAIEQTCFRLMTVLDNLATLMTATAEDKAIDLVIVPPACSRWTLRGDPLRLGQVLSNLANNAIKFTEAGVVEVRCEPIETHETWLWLRFTVRDTGIGIDAAAQSLLFEPFSQADASTTRRFGGTGLGLAISRRLVELMGGRIGLDSTPGQGSTFWFELPFELVEEEPQDARVALPMRVLVVDAHPSVRDGLVATVAALGWSATVADSAEAAVRQVLDDPAWQGPDAAVLLDCRNLAPARAIREALPASHWPLLFVLASCPVAPVRDSPDANLVEAVLAQPLVPSPLYDAVVRARRQRLGEDVRPEHPASHAQRLGGLRLLVVDDSEINREVARRIFADEGAGVRLACDGQEALDWLRAHPDEVDVVLMDVQMPVMDGHEATRRIRQNPGIAGLPVIALTAGAMHAQEVLAQEAGMDAFLSKPFEVENAVAVILSLRPGGPAPVRPAAESGIAAVAVPSLDPAGAANPSDYPGLAITRGLAIWKDAAVYRRYLRQLAREYGDAAQRIAAAEPPAAKRLAHTLKGAAGNLGLTEVAACAGELERLLATPGEVDQIVDQIRAATTALQTALETALDSIGRFAPEAPDLPQQGEVARQGAPDPARIAPLIRTALGAFADFDPLGAEPSVTQLACHLPSELLAPLRAAIDNLDATAGEAAARDLATRLGVRLAETSVTIQRL